MISDEQYKRIMSRGVPVSSRPHMDLRRRAKIFLAFDALVGFDEEVETKTVPYIEKRELNTEEKAELDRRMNILAALIPDTKAAREKNVKANVSVFKICEDPHSESYHKKGLYETVSGTVWKVDTMYQTLTVGKEIIKFENIAFLEAEKIFEKDEEEVC